MKFWVLSLQFLWAHLTSVILINCLQEDKTERRSHILASPCNFKGVKKWVEIVRMFSDSPLCLHLFVQTPSLHGAGSVFLSGLSIAVAIYRGLICSRGPFQAVLIPSLFASCVKILLEITQRLALLNNTDVFWRMHHQEISLCKYIPTANLATGENK